MPFRSPPAVPTWLLSLASRRFDGESLIGDLIEEYQAGRSDGWYWRQCSHACLQAVRLDFLKGLTRMAGATIAIGWMAFLAVVASEGVPLKILQASAPLVEHPDLWVRTHIEHPPSFLGPPSMPWAVTPLRFGVPAGLSRPVGFPLQLTAQSADPGQVAVTVTALYPLVLEDRTGNEATILMTARDHVLVKLTDALSRHPRHFQIAIESIVADTH